jgi:hypothetical protein
MGGNTSSVGADGADGEELQPTLAAQAAPTTSPATKRRGAQTRPPAADLIELALAAFVS